MDISRIFKCQCVSHPRICGLFFQQTEISRAEYTVWRNLTTSQNSELQFEE